MFILIAYINVYLDIHTHSLKLCYSRHNALTESHRLADKNSSPGYGIPHFKMSVIEVLDFPQRIMPLPLDGSQKLETRPYC